MSFISWRALDERDEKYVHNTILLEAKDIRETFITRFNSRVRTLSRTAKRWEFGNFRQEKSWEKDAQLLLKDFPSLEILSWVDAKYNTQWIQGTEGLNLPRLSIGTNPRDRNLLDTAREENEIIVLSPNGISENVLVICVPLYSKGQFDGFLVSVWSIHGLLKSILPLQKGYSFAVFNGDEKIFEQPNSNVSIDDEWKAEVFINFYEQKWIFRLWPSPKSLRQIKSIIPEVTLGFGLIFSILFSVLVRFIQITKEAERKLIHQAKELLSLNDDLTQYAYISSHDLKEPLRTIKVHTQLLTKKLNTKDKDIETLSDFISEGVDRIYNLIDALLLYFEAGKGRKDFRLASAEDCLHQALEQLHDEIQKQRVHIVQDELPFVYANHSDLTMVFYQLVSNAIKFRTDSNCSVQIGCTSEKQEWIFFVRDNGIGIDEKYRDRIFLIFQRLQSRGEYKGIGIGLALCKRIIENHKGRIWFSSDQTKGTTFYFTLPRRPL
jgi:signal transduction histidine kinase